MKKWLTLFDACSGVSTDSRNIAKNCLYIALKGNNFNGNLFAQQAIAAGAKYAIVDEAEYADETHIFYVENSLVFLQQLANAHRNRFDVPVLGITGSNGKTSTKELINCALSCQFKVLCTEGNLNNHIGVPLTLLRLNSTHEIAIIEMGANKPFDIDELCRIARPTHGIITNIGKAHLEGFLSFEGVLKTKSELYDHVAANSGVVFVNSDDAVLTNALASRKVKVHSFGEQNGEIRGELTFLDPFVHFRWSQENYSSPLLATQMIGKYNFTNFLAAISIGLHFGVAPDTLNSALCAYVPANKRSQVEQGISNTLIVDCYNANPSSMASALDSFVEMKHENKLVLLGDMLELGADGPAEHHKIIEFLKQHQLAFHTVGPLFKAQHQNGFETTSDLVAYLNENPPKNSLILLKGSRGIALEQTLDVLRAN